MGTPWWLRQRSQAIILFGSPDTAWEVPWRSWQLGVFKRNFITVHEVTTFGADDWQRSGGTGI